MAASVPPATPEQQLLQLRTELEELAQRKQLVEEQITHIEQQIYSFEDSYLEDTLATGNVIRGFDNYLGLRPMPNVEKRKLKVKDTDRLFSRTSATYERSMGIVHAPDGGGLVDEIAHAPQRPDSPDDDDDEAALKRKKKLKRPHRDTDDHLDVS